MASVKREFDPDTKTEEPSFKKPRIALDAPKKETIIKFIAYAHYLLHILIMKNDDPFLLNINVGIQISNILSSLFVIFKQEITKKGGKTKAQAEKTGFSVQYKNNKYPINLTAAYEAFISAARRYRLRVVDTDIGDDLVEDWVGTCGPYLNFLSGYGYRLKELRLGHGEMVLTKDNNTTKVYNMSKFGLNRTHHILLEGIRFPPEKRSSMIQSLGPLTALINYLLSPKEYRNKFQAACLRAFQHIPDFPTILSMITDKSISEIKNIIQLIADISIIITTRQATRGFPPPNVFCKLLLDQDSILENHAAFRRKQDFGFFPARAVNVSGHGLFLMYKKACLLGGWRFCGRFDSNEYQQINFHCWFGTYKEDLGILASITNINRWSTRDSLKDKFQKINTQGEEKEFNMVELKAYSKLSSASQVPWLAQTQKQTASVPCFSGYRTRSFSNDFFKHLNDTFGKTAFNNSLSGVASELSQILDYLVKRIQEEGGIQDAGVMEWRTMENLDVDQPGNVLPNFIPKENCNYFLS